MVYYIYLDVFFAFNVLMDFFVLMIVRRWNGCRKKWWFCLVAGVVGGIYAVFSTIIEMQRALQWVLTYLVVGQILVGLSMEWKGIKVHIRRLMQLYVGVFLLCGCIVVLSNMTGMQRNIYRTTGISGAIDGKFSVAMAGFCYIFLWSFITRIRVSINQRRRITKVDIMLNGETSSLQALCDTGNSLTEPITGKPVCVVDRSVVENIEKEQVKPIFIPYNTIDKKNGMMKGIWVEEMHLLGKVYKKVPVAIHQGKISQNKIYEMILHPDYFEERGEKYDFRKRKN